MHRDPAAAAAAPCTAECGTPLTAAACCLLLLQVWRARRAGSLQTVAVKLITKHGKNEKDLRSLRQASAATSFH